MIEWGGNSITMSFYHFVILSFFHMNIILVGLPGCGKSTLGRRLSGRLQMPYIDLDKVIEEKEGISVPEIFGGKGEEYFRKLEAECLVQELDKQQGIILATGGGAPCFHGNMDVILAKGISIYLEVPFEELAKRLFAQGVEKRPLLEGIKEPAGLVSLLEEKFAYRIPYYKKADLHFLNSSRSPVAELVEKIQASPKFKA